jgi:hypothetical protein
MKKNRFLGSLVAMAGAVVAVAFLAVGPVGGQDAPAAPPAKGGKGGGKQAVPPGPVPRTKEGKPDMSGFWGGVAPSAATSIEPAQAKGGGGGKGGGKGAPGGDAAAKGGPGGGKGGPGGGKGGDAVAKGGPPPGGAPGGGAAKAKGKNLIVSPEDGRVPYTVAARAKSDNIIANRMFLEPELHCYMSGAPHNMWVQFGLQTIQTKDYLVFMWEFHHDRRIIPIDGRPHQLPDTVRQFQGESAGKWEGDTLVIETKNQTHHTWFDTSGHFAPEDIHVVERLTMINSNQIEYKATVTSPTEFTQPMELEGMINRANANDPKYEQMEFACVEGNQDLQHYTQDKGGKAQNVGARTQ